MTCGVCGKPTYCYIPLCDECAKIKNKPNVEGFEYDQVERTD